ncbi:hypothetical protein Taro_034100 [Colocasia esculenta]|uniref:Uncharacterized protein n=1 Tax=Colocasia esculenta TaxID=4460 RepID=A0A843VZT3_COLES|nr:hypothetical protein [Colocasia esculenta]
MTQAPTSRTSTRSRRNNQASPQETPNSHVRSNVSPQARPPQTSVRSRVHKQNQLAPRTLHEVRELHPPVPHEQHQGTGYRNSSWVPAQGTLRETAEWKPLNTAHEAKPTKPTELDTARLQPPCRLGQRETQSRNQHVKQRHRKNNQATATSN